MFPAPKSIPGVAELHPDHPGHKLEPNRPDGLAKLAADHLPPDHPAMTRAPYNPNKGLAVAPVEPVIKLTEVKIAKPTAKK